MKLSIYTTQTTLCQPGQRGSLLLCFPFTYFREGLPNHHLPHKISQIKDLTQCESKQYLYSKRKATLYSWDTGQTMKLPTIQTIRLGNLRPDLACYLEICFITLTRMLRLRMRHTTAPLLEKNGKKYSNCPNQCPAQQKGSADFKATHDLANSQFLLVNALLF